MMQQTMPFFDATMLEPADAPPDLSQHAEIELDFESDGLGPTSLPIGAAVGTPERQYYVAWGHRGGGNSTDPETARRWLASLRGKRISNHTIKADLHWARRFGVDLRDGGTRFHDVSHSAALLDDHRKTFSLEALAQAELGEGKTELFSKTNLADLPAGAVAGYAKQDVRLVRRLQESYAPRLERDSLLRVSDLEDDLIPSVVEMEANGMPLDLDLLSSWLDSSQKILEKLQWELYKLCGTMINPDAPTDMVRLWLQCGEKIERTETGAPSFTAPIVQAAAAKHPRILLAWRIGKLQDLRSKYLQKYANEHVNGVLYPTLHQLRTDDAGTVSGRFSCVRPNLQQVMGKDKHKAAYGWLTEYGTEDYLIKRLFLPASGRFFSTDAKQLEYRIFVHYSQSERLIQRYRDDPEVNFHHIVRALVERVQPDVDHTRVKVGNFTSMFGGTEVSLAQSLRISKGAAKEFLDTYHAGFPEVRILQDKAKDAVRARGYVKSLMGRRSRFVKVGGSEMYDRLHKALNAVIQPSAADLVKLKMIRLYNEQKRLGLLLRMTVHDQFAADVPADDHLGPINEVLAIQEYPLSVPILWDSKLGNNWAEAG